MLEKDDKQSTESEVIEDAKQIANQELSEDRAEVAEEENPKPEGFSDFSLNDKLVECLVAKGWSSPTPIQEQALVHTLEGKDLVGLAQTGSGKTGAFLITMAQRLFADKDFTHKRKPKAPACLVICPVRELAAQIEEEANHLLHNIGLKTVSLVGGTGFDAQIKALEDGVDLVVATPGRLIDLHKKELICLDGVKLFVCDEVDRMFDLGFKKDIDYLFANVSNKAQKLVFSATFDENTKEVCQEFLSNPEFVHLHQEEKTPDTMKQEAIVCETADKIKLLLYLLKQHDPACAIVFTNTKLVAAWLHFKLENNGYNAQMISGDLPQNKRTKLISEIKAGKVRVLIATDVASRGLHIAQVSHVYNFDLPHEAANYIHRIGRTARGGASGESYSFICEDYGHNFEAIQKLLGAEAPKPQLMNPELYLSVEDLAKGAYEKKSSKAPSELREVEPVGGFKRRIPRNDSTPKEMRQPRKNSFDRPERKERVERKPQKREQSFKPRDNGARKKSFSSKRPPQSKAPKTLGGMMKRIVKLIFRSAK